MSAKIARDEGDSLRDVIDEVTRRIVSIANPARVLLFGSMARGEIRPDSDLDVLVIVKGPAQRRKLGQAIYRNLHGVSVPVDVVVATEEDIERYGDKIGTILRPALREGHVIYESP